MLSLCNHTVKLSHNKFDAKQIPFLLFPQYDNFDAKQIPSLHRCLIMEPLDCGRVFLLEEESFFPQVCCKRSISQTLQNSTVQSKIVQCWVKICQHPRLLQRQLAGHGLVGHCKTSKCRVHRRFRTQHRSSFRNLTPSPLLLFWFELCLDVYILSIKKPEISCIPSWKDAISRLSPNVYLFNSTVFEA